jgi:uncharacterized protein YdhG (YjbR/CyaY superfamily)
VTKATTTEEYILAQPAELQVQVNRLREVVHETAPELTETYYAGYQMISYGPTSNMKQQVLYIAAQPKHTNIGFYQGTELEDPTRMLKGTGKKLLHVKIKTVAAVDHYTK